MIEMEQSADAILQAANLDAQISNDPSDSEVDGSSNLSEIEAKGAGEITEEHIIVEINGGKKPHIASIPLTSRSSHNTLTDEDEQPSTDQNKDVRSRDRASEVGLAKHDTNSKRELNNKLHCLDENILEKGESTFSDSHDKINLKRERKRKRKSGNDDLESEYMQKLAKLEEKESKEREAKRKNEKVQKEIREEEVEGLEPNNLDRKVAQKLESVGIKSEILHVNGYPPNIGTEKKIANDSSVLHQDDDSEIILDPQPTTLEADVTDSRGDVIVNEEDEIGISLRNEEAIEKKRMAQERLNEIELQFSTFRDRLYQERLKQLNDEDFMLRQSQPSHPEYLAWLKCLDAWRDERIRIADNLQRYKLQCLKKVAVAQRSQILAQYQQEIRNVREKKLEQLGEQWYKIQNDRRSVSGISPDYSLRFPKKRAQQLSNHIAYCSEVSILSGIAKYVGFPAAPTMAPASATELEEDLEKMSRLKQNSQAPLAIPLHDIVALRAVSSYSKFKPKEEHNIEQTSWANPQHLSLIQKQASSSQVPRTISPFPQAQVPLHRNSPQQGCQSSSLFPTQAVQHHITVIKGNNSLQNSNGNLTLAYKIPPSRTESRQTSLPPNSNRALTNLPDIVNNLSKTQPIPNIKSSTLSPATGVKIEHLRESRLST